MKFLIVSLLSFMLMENAIAKPRVPEKKDFSSIEARLERLTGMDKLIVGQVQYGAKNYPIYALVTVPKKLGDNRKDVLLSAGVHGDEPAGVFATLEFLEKHAAEYKDRFRFFVFPCVNPSGFEADQLESSGGQNINRSFKKETPSAEARLVMEQLAKWNRIFAFAMDMHEIPPYWADEGFTEKDNPHAAYLYETHVDKTKRIGRAMIDALPKGTEVSQWPKIYGDVADRGLVSYPEGNLNKVYAEATTLDGYVQGRFSPHTFTNETPTDWALEKRIRTQLSWLRTALDKH